MSYNETVKDCLESVLDLILDELEDIKEDDSEQIDINDLMHQEVDNAVSTNSRQENLTLIDDTGHENTIDKGLVDTNADITMQIAQVAYGCLEQEIWDDDLMQEIQRSISDNDMIDYDTAQELIPQIKDRLAK